MSVESFAAYVREHAQRIAAHPPAQVVLLHHNDTDGLSSGAILGKAFERLQVPQYRYCLEKPYPEVVRTLLAERDLPAETLVVFADFASGMLPTIAETNVHQRPVLVLDHHTITSVADERITVLNPRAFGVSGDRACAASAICALFASEVSPLNNDLSALGVLGAIGDRQYTEDGSLEGVNLLVAERATERVSRDNGGWRILTGEHEQCNADELRVMVDALGSFGYLRGGPDIAIKGLLEGFDRRYRISAERLQQECAAHYQELLLSAPFRQQGQITYFSLGASFSQMGVKTVGLLCEWMLRDGVVPLDHYLAGFQPIPPMVPGVPLITSPMIKVSMRVPAPLRFRIERGELPPLTELLVPATEALGGFVDACHLFAAATTIAPGDEDPLITAMTARLGMWIR